MEVRVSAWVLGAIASAVLLTLAASWCHERTYGSRAEDWSFVYAPRLHGDEPAP